MELTIKLEPHQHLLEKEFFGWLYESLTNQELPDQYNAIEFEKLPRIIQKRLLRIRNSWFTSGFVEKSIPYEENETIAKYNVDEQGRGYVHFNEIVYEPRANGEMINKHHWRLIGFKINAEFNSGHEIFDKIPRVLKISGENKKLLMKIKKDLEKGELKFFIEYPDQKLTNLDKFRKYLFDSRFFMKYDTLERASKNADAAWNVHKKIRRISKKDLRELYFLKGVCDASRKKYKNAEKLLKRLTKLDPKHYDGLYNLALVYSHTKRKKKAYESFKKALELSPKNHSILAQLGFLAVDIGKKKEAIEYLEKAKKLAPEHAPWHISGAKSFLEKVEKKLKELRNK